MTAQKKDFFGKEVTDAIKAACDQLGVAQEQLEIEVVETGSTGIFGLIRKKAHIRAFVKEVVLDEEVTQPAAEKEETAAEKEVEPPPKKKPARPPKKQVEVIVQEEEDADDEDEDDEDDASETEDTSGVELEESVVALIKEELDALLNHMGYPSSIEVTAKGISVNCKVGAEYQQQLTGQDGKTLDSLQYLLRKIVARKVPDRLRLSVDVGTYREDRLVELKARAIELAAKVKEDGKTQVIPALSPSERRVIHMSLQDDKEIRSRSVGEGLFKKILIYKPGRSNKNNSRRRSGGRGRRGNSQRKKSS